MKKQLVIDGNSILNRAFFGTPPLTNKAGLPTGALHGFATILIGQLEALNPEYATVAFDLPQPTFRHIAYSEYKAGRHKMPDELAAQLPYAHKLAEALGFNVTEIAGYEADDILGTLSASADNDTMTYLLTGDRDSLQLINERVHVLYATKGENIDFGPAEFTEKYGVLPSQFVDVKAVMGDSSDNIPGVAGIGEKGALKLIAQFGSLDGIYENIGSADIAKGVRAKLEAGKDSAYNSRFLAKIKTDVPTDGTETLYHGYDKEKLYPLLCELEFTKLIERLGFDKAETENKVSDVLRCDVSVCGADEINSLKKSAFSLSDGVLCIYADGAAMRYDGELSVLKEYFESPDSEYTVYDIKSLKKYLAEHGICFASPEQDGHITDIMLAAYIKNPLDGDYSLDSLQKQYIGQNVDFVPQAISMISEKLMPILTEEKQDRLLRGIECPLASVLSDMEKTGFKVDLDGLKKWSEKLGADAERLSEEIYAIAGKKFNINSPKQLGEVLFEDLAMPAPKKTRTGYSTSADVLEKLRPYNPIIDKILEYRQVAKLKSTYADGLASAADETGRIHSSFNQTVTATGRLSSTEPNLQNIPIRTTLGRELRRCFIPESSDYVLVDADYSQIELRLLACISGDERMIKAFLSGEDIHRATASQVFAVPMDEVTPELRKRAKAVNFGIVYGIGDFSLAADIGVSRRQAGAYIDSYLEKYSGIDAYMSDIKAFARENGYVSTLFGRRRPIPELTAGKAQLRAFGERVAMNSPIQGTAADIMKLAMINTDRALKKSGLDAKLILQVHDELVIECRREDADAVSEILKREMEGAADFAVPLTAEVTVGDNWYKE